MDAERRLQAGQHRRPFGGRNKACDMAVSGDVVAEQNDEVGIQRVGALDNAVDAIERHPGIAGVKVGDRGDPELKSPWPSRRREIVAGDAEPHDGFAEPVGGGGNAERAQRAHGFQKMTTGQHVIFNRDALQDW